MHIHNRQTGENRESGEPILRYLRRNAAQVEHLSYVATEAGAPFTGVLVVRLRTESALVGLPIEKAAAIVRGDEFKNAERQRIYSDGSVEHIN